MAEAEMPVTSLAALMGHAQVTTTQIYTAGAGVTVQADYQAAMERLDAVRQEEFPAGSVEPGGAAVGGKELDVWRLAGVEPTDYAASQPVVEVEMDLSRYWEGLPDWLTERMQV